jgi:hypothetical protein
MWVGLFNLTVLIVFAVTGLEATIWPAVTASSDVRFVPYEAPGDFSDADIAADVYETLDPPMSGPIPEWALQRNATNALVLDFYSPNGVVRVTVLEPERQLRVEQTRHSLGAFMSAMHVTTWFTSPPDLRVRLWGLYVDLSIFSLLFMAVTGVWLWLASRPRLWWAQASLAAGSGAFALLWLVTM